MAGVAKEKDLGSISDQISGTMRRFSLENLSSDRFVGRVGGFNPPLVPLNPQVCIDPRKNSQNKSKIHC